MSGERRKNKFIKRRSWGGIRCRLRQRFAKGQYEVGPEFLRPERTCYNFGGDPSRVRWQMKNHPERFKKNKDNIIYFIANMRGSEWFERRFGIHFLRCRTCGEKIWHRFLDDLLDGLCNKCARPFINKRYEIQTEAQRRRAEQLAIAMLPAIVVAELKTIGWTRINAPNSIVYYLTKEGTVYNATLRQYYCVHPATGWLGACYWDRLVEMWILLRQVPAMVEAKAHKSLMSESSWNGQFGKTNTKGAKSKSRGYRKK